MKDLKQDENIDGGWAWVIMVASFFCHFCCYGLAWSTGVFHLMFLQAFEQSSALTAWAASLISAVMFMSGALSSYMTNRWGVRWTVIIGTLISSAGIAVCSMASNIFLIYFAFGILGGVGFGIVYVPSVSILAYYFNKRRILANGIAASGVGIGMFAWPPIITFLNQEYGWRGAMMVVGAINLNMMVAGCVMRPLKKEKPPVLTASRELLAKNLNQSEGYHKRKTFAKTMHLGLFKRLEFIMLCFNNFLICFGLSIVFIHIAAFAQLKTNATSAQAAFLISVNGIANLVGRLAFAFLGQVPRINVTLTYMLCFIVAGMMTVACPFIPVYEGLLVYSALFGLSTGCFGVFLFAIIIRLVDVERLPSALGYVIIFEGIGMLSGAPIAGLVYDLLRWYDASLYIGGASVILSALFMIPALRYSAPVIDVNSPQDDYVADTALFQSGVSIMGSVMFVPSQRASSACLAPSTRHIESVVNVTSV